MSVSTLNTKFYECKGNNWLVCCILSSAQQTPKRSGETWTTIMDDVWLGSWATCIYIFNYQSRAIKKSVICFEV